MAKKLTVTEIKRLVARPKTEFETLTAIEDILKDPLHWIQSAEVRSPDHKDPDAADDLDDDSDMLALGELSRKDRITGVCLIGGVRLVDGKYEDEVAVALAFAAAILFPLRVESFNDDPDEEELDRLLREWATKGARALEINDYIVEFNDDDDTKHKDVMAVISKARSLLMQIAQLREILPTYNALIADMKTVPKPKKTAKKPMKKPMKKVTKKGKK